MAQLTLRDIASNEEIVVPPEGFVFGRAGGDADIQLDDATIGKRQARISSFQGRWVLEVMVVPPGQRLPKPQPLQEGQTFYIGESEFEVVALEAEQESPARAAGKAPAPPSSSGGGRARPGGTTPAPRTVPATPVAKKPAPRPAAEEAPAASPAPGGSAGDRFKALFVGVPRGIAYYLVNVPLLLVNPMGTVRRTLAEQPSEPLGREALIGYALPALLVSALLGSIAGGIALLIGGGGFSFSAFVPIVPAVGAVVGALLVGWFFHPVLGWFIGLLKGESDARSRSNYFLQTMTLAIVLAVPQALGGILAAVPLPFINLLGPLLLMVASLVSLYVTYQWFVHFKVVQWFRYVLLALGALTVLGSAANMVLLTVAAFTGGGTAVAAPSADVEEAARLAREAAERAARENTARARAAATGAQDTAEHLARGAGAEAAPVAAPEPEKRPPAAAVTTPPPAEEPRPKPPPPGEEAKAPAGSGGGYAAFAARRDAVERALAADPLLLARSAEVQRLYGSYLATASGLQKRYEREAQKDPDRARLHALLRDAELYKATGSTVDQLAERLGLH